MQITDRAANALQQLLHQRHVPDGQIVRIVAKQPAGFDLRVEYPQPGDELIRRQEVPLLAMDADLSPQLASCVLDFGLDKESQRVAFTVTRE